MPKPFLTADWRHVCILTYTCPRDLLLPHCPPGTALELYNGRAHISLVAFDFSNTRVFGIGWPGFRNFPEINLRFYVTDNDRRGVVFIREYVPSAFVAWLARHFYNEPYLAADTTSEVTRDNGNMSVTHRVSHAGTHNTLHIVADPTTHLPAPDTIDHHFKEHQWGFGKDRVGNQVLYEVRHPHWRIFPLKSLELDWNWKQVYGPQWAFLQQQEPVSVILAEGSGVEVFRPG